MNPGALSLAQHRAGSTGKAHSLSERRQSGLQSKHDVGSDNRGFVSFVNSWNNALTEIAQHDVG